MKVTKVIFNQVSAQAHFATSDEHVDSNIML